MHPIRYRILPAGVARTAASCYCETTATAPQEVCAEKGDHGTADLGASCDGGAVDPCAASREKPILEIGAATNQDTGPSIPVIVITNVTLDGAPVDTSAARTNFRWNIERATARSRRGFVLHRLGWQLHIGTHGLLKLETAVTLKRDPLARRANLPGRLTGLLWFSLVLGCVDSRPDANLVREDSVAPVPPAEHPDSAMVTLFFTRGEEAAPVTRSVPDTAAGPEMALRLLLQGPTPDERHEGVHSWFSAATADQLDSVGVSNAGELVVYFRDLSTVIPNASSSAGSAMLLRELNSTLFQFPQVQSIDYRMRGSCEAFWNWLQFGCHIVTRSGTGSSTTTAQ